MSGSAVGSLSRTRIARPSFAAFSLRFLLALTALMQGELVLAQPCNLQAVPPTSAVRGPSQPASFSFRLIDAATTPVAGTCDGSTGVIAITSPAAGSGAVLGSTTWSANLGETVTFTVTSSPTAENTSIRASCTGGSAACTAGSTTPATFFLQTVIRTVDVVSGDGASGETGGTIQLEAAALNNGLRPFTAVPITWAVTSGNATLAPATGSSGQYSQAITIVTLGTATSTSNNTVTVTATRTDAPEAAPAVFTLTINVYELIQVSPPDNTTAQAGTAVPLTVELRRNGLPLGDVNINWDFNPLPTNGSTLATPSSLTIGDGTARNTLTIGQPNPGNPPANIVVRALAFQGDAVRERTVTFVIAPRDVLAMTASAGSGQTASVGDPVANPFVVNVTRNGAADNGSVINWSVSPANAVTFAGGLSTAQSTVAGGVASMTIQRVNASGPITITATHNDDPSITATFALTGTAPTLAFDSPTGDGQSAPINTRFASLLGLRATRNGVPESGVQINWSVSPAGAASLDSTQTFTTVNGDTSNGVTAGSTGGPFTVTATRNDDPSITFTFNLTALDQRLIKPATGSGDGQSGTPNQPLAQPLVAVATSNGAPQSGVMVNWTVTGGDAIITSTTNPTDNAGRSTAQVSFGPTASTVTIQAQRSDVPSQVQIYTLVSTDVRTLTKPATGSGDGQTGLTGGNAAEPLVVIARNNGVPVGGVTVLWSVTGDATLSASQTSTAADGSTSVTVQFGQNPGQVTVTATRQDAPASTATFVLTSFSAITPTLSLEKPANSGDGTSAAPGTVVALSVRALRNAQPDANVDVFWELVSGNAQLGRAASTSDGSGIATNVVTLGNVAGPVQVRATRADASAASVLFTLTTTGAVTSESLVPVSGNGQRGQPGAVGAPLVVRYTRNNAAVSGAAVTWRVIEGSVSLSAGSTTTASDGTSQVGVTFGTTPGPIRVTATAGGVTAQFDLSIVQVAQGLSLRLVSGNRQAGAIGTRADLPIVVEVLDGNGTAVSGQGIEWEVVSGSATVDALITQTGSDGRSSQGLRFGPTPGAILLRARIPGSAVLFVNIDATSFVPTLAIFSGNNQSGPVSTLLPQDLVVIISAPPGSANTLAGVTVRWQVASGGGTIASATTTTGVDGKSANRLTLGPNAGANSVTASIDGGGSVTFNATGTATAGPLVIVSGNSQMLPTATPSAALVVELRSANGQPVVGATLDWTAVNATFVDGIVSTTTDAQGRSRNVVKVTLPGAASVTVKVRGNDANRVVFTLNGGVANVPTLNAPQETVANAIDQLCPALFRASNLTPAQVDLLARCLELVNNAGDNPSQVENALLQLQQDVALAQANAALVTAATQFDNVKARIAALRSGKRGADFGGLAVATASGMMPLSFLPSSVVQSEGEAEGGGETDAATEIGADFDRWGFFASGILGRGQHDAGSVTPEYDFDTNGLTAGVDYRVRDNWFVGASLGYNQADTELANSSGGIDTKGWSISGYTTWFHQNNWYMDGVLSFGSNDYDLNRRIAYDIVGASGGLTRVDQLAEASTGGDQLSAALSVGRDFQKGAWSYGPYLRGTYTRVEFDAYQERLADGIGSGLGLSVDSRALKSMTGVLGGKVTYAMSRDWGVLMPHAQLEWEHEFKDDPQRLVTRFLHDPTGTSIVMNGDTVDSNYYNIGFGLSALFPGGRSAFFYYEHLAGSEGLTQDNLAVGVRIEF